MEGWRQAEGTANRSIKGDIIEGMTLLIKNVRVLGGAQPFPNPIDVFVNGDKISAIGNFPRKTADVMLDGQDAYLAPGFIDVNTDSDHYLTLFEYPSQEDFLKQGVTTVFGGMCGASLAPLLYGSLESIRKWTNPDRVNVNWHTMREFLQTLERRPLGVNFGTMAGHSTIRRAIVGESTRDLTKNELNVFAEVLRRAIREGAFGLSTGLEYTHSKKTPYSELAFLAGATKELGGVYATHLRDTGLGVKEATEEAVRLAKETKIRTLVSHFIPAIGAEKEYTAALETLEGVGGSADIRFDIYPSEQTLYPLYTFLPPWARSGNNLAGMLANLDDEWMRSKLEKELPHVNPDDFVIAHAPKNDFLVGRSLRDISGMYDIKEPRSAMIRLMAALRLQGTVLYRSLNPVLIKRALASDRSFIASNAPSFGADDPKGHLRSERTQGTFTAFLSLVLSEDLMPLEDAVRKITLEPARFFGLAGRGEIKEGNFADLVCFKGPDVRFTVVNGAVAYKGGEFQRKFSGKALRHVPVKAR